jgi:hypothetical protein
MEEIVLCILSEGDTCVESCPRMEKCYPEYKEDDVKTA